MKDCLILCPKCKAKIIADNFDSFMLRVYCKKCNKMWYHPFFKACYDGGCRSGINLAKLSIRQALGFEK